MNNTFFPLLFALLLLGVLAIHQPAHSQSITPIGSENTLEIATWNIEWFGSTSQQPSNDALQLSNARKVIAESDIDFWGVQEISSTTAFDDLLSALGSNYDGVLATNSGAQRVGYIYNTDVIRVRQVRHILESSEFEFAFRPPLQMEVDVMLADTTVIMTFIVVHMKAFADQDGYERRQAAASRLKNHIDFTTLSSKPVVVLGDFNDELTNSIYRSETTPYDNFLADTDNYTFLSYPLEMDGFGSFCSGSSCTTQSSIVDHILITDELFAEVDIAQPAGVLEQAPEVINAYGASTSDHLPVYARFTFNGGVASSNEPEDIPQAFDIQPPFPNPLTSSATLSYSLDTPSHVRLEIYDLMGRKVWFENQGYVQSGTHQRLVDLSNQASGTYYLRVSINETMSSFPLIRAGN
ncbi:MAG: T9SS type A sorting domain-containing protein [Rhodothermaceae bacterium]|nr:T9SS type A sorting domain-containing protein [Rhodothermaceae bacterium]